MATSRPSEVAEHLAEICRQAGRASDVFGRLGQLEFAVIAGGTGAEGAVRLIDRMKSRIEQEQLSLAGVERRMRVRAGYYAVPDFASSALDAEEILLRATTALRQLRQEGSDVDIRSFDDVPLPARH
jgi:diguanylate cyclase (GGDEF)-like protein